jgi:hypothetical protein
MQLLRRRAVRQKYEKPPEKVQYCVFFVFGGRFFVKKALSSGFDLALCLTLCKFIG